MAGKEKKANAKQRPPRPSKRARMAQRARDAAQSVHDRAGQAQRSQQSTLSANAPPFYSRSQQLPPPPPPEPSGPPHQNVLPAPANPTPAMMDNPLAPPNAPRGPRNDREGRNRPSANPQPNANPQPSNQLAHFDHGRQDACEEYMYRGMPEYQEWKKVRNSLRRSRLGRIGELTGEQQMVPQNFTEFLQHKAAMKGVLEDEQKERDQAQQQGGEVHFEFHLSGIAAVEPFTSSVLGKETIWTSITSDWRTDWTLVSPWPSIAELREDGDERHTSQYGRHLPCPRELGNPSQSWKQKLYKPASELDFVNPVPDRLFFPRVPRDEFGCVIDDEDEPGSVALVAKNPFMATAAARYEMLGVPSGDRWRSGIGREDSQEIRRDWALPPALSQIGGLELIKTRMKSAGLDSTLSALRIMDLPPASPSSRDTHSHNERSLVPHPSSRVSQPSSASSLPPHHHSQQQHQEAAATGSAAKGAAQPTWSVGPSPSAEQLENDPIFKSFAVLYQKPERRGNASHLYEGSRGNEALASQTDQPRLTAADILPKPRGLIKPTVASKHEETDDENDDTSSEKTIMP